MRGMQGALIVASCFQMLIGFLGVWRNVVRFLTPLSMVPLMTFTVLGLYYLGFQMLAKCVEIGIPELILMVIVSQAHLYSLSWLYIPYPFRWGRPTFQAGEAFAMMAASLESTGTFLATARYGSATPVPASVLKGYKQDNLQVQKIYSPVHD
ncbi:hypothetical protein RHMOL_Rhmol07G0172300 [Rhododendron molle]|uniref:Uncharacterized protein n=1 Tax=Rhododendron molle TaxID=49168 RepID=A0ACC0N2P9_RHOML|nr:hypothetical protein RHMOL_Rhmol07G0172300 [Rhododendron molle]